MQIFRDGIIAQKIQSFIISLLFIMLVNKLDNLNIALRKCIPVSFYRKFHHNQPNQFFSPSSISSSLQSQQQFVLSSLPLPSRILINIFNIKPMRRGFSPVKNRTLEDIDYCKERDEPQRPSKLSSASWKNFCHYNNAVYMGGMSSSQKHGKGLLLHDDGASVITEYYHDTPSGHNIIFRENSITSIVYKDTVEYDISFKTGRYIIKIPFTDNTHRSNGSGFLIDYEDNKIFELLFENGRVVEKILHLNRRNNEEVFKRNAVTRIVGVKHEQAFELTFEKPENMHVKYDHKELTVGYYNGDGDLHGLGFKSHAENAEVSGVKSLFIKPIERGYYRNGLLQTFGEKFFSNGNKYIGEFQEGEYNGQGILLCPQELKWVYGEFTDGKLVEVIDSNNEKHTRNEYDAWVDSLWQIHKRYAERWIDMSIQLPHELYLERILNEALEMRVTSVDPDHEQGEKQDKYSLDKIQHQFIEGFPGDSKRSYVDQELDHHYNRKVAGGREYSPRIKEKGKKSRNEKFIPERDYLDDPKIKRQEDYEYEPKRYNTNSPYTGVQPYSYRSRYQDRSPRYYNEGSIDGIYRKTYFDSLERQKERLRKLENEDKYYLRNLREELANSPVHRKYKASPRYDPYDRTPYYEPTESYVRRVPQTPKSRITPPSYYQPQTVPSSSRPSRLPYRNSPPSRNYIQNNYKHWK